MEFPEPEEIRTPRTIREELIQDLNDEYEQDKPRREELARVVFRKESNEHGNKRSGGSRPR